MLVSLLLAITPEPTAAQEPLAQPPAGQTYVGSKECGLCHSHHLADWQSTSHAKAFDILPEKHRADGSCLKCHATGHGQPSGFKSLKDTPNLAGVTCESCHGPGSKHAEVAKSLGNQKLTKQERAYVGSTIHLMLPKNVCVECHAAQAHKQEPQ